MSHESMMTGSVAHTTRCLPDWSESQKHLMEGETFENMRDLATYTSSTQSTSNMCSNPNPTQLDLI